GAEPGRGGAMGPGGAVMAEGVWVGQLGFWGGGGSPSAAAAGAAHGLARDAGASARRRHARLGAGAHRPVRHPRPARRARLDRRSRAPAGLPRVRLTRMQTETFALIVGGGPVGLSAALDLSWRGVPNVRVSENLRTAQHPKCNNTNARSMEHFRRIGIAKELRAEGLPAGLARASAYVTRFCGHEYGRQPRPYATWPTPEIPNTISQ